MISASNLTMRFGGKILFKQAHLQLLPGVHYGLVGSNGSGKSTLIKILIGDVVPEAGDVATPNQINVGALKQDHFMYENDLIKDVVLMGRPKLWQALQAKEVLLEKADFNEDDCELLAKYEKVIEEQMGYVAESEAAQLLEGLGIATARHTLPLRSLSGGYKLRVLLAQLLFSKPDIMLLDEPTNHLDLYSIRWLEEYLKTFPGTLLLSSHDKQFLNSVCNSMIDVDYGTIKTYKGNYDAFHLAKEEQKVLKENLLSKQDKRKEELMDFVDRFKAKASKARQAASKMKQVEKLEDAMEENHLAASSRKYPNLKFDICRQSGATALTLKGLGKSYGEKLVLKNVDLVVERGERVAFLGVNGIGKSTLLEILTNHVGADEGVFTWGFETHVGYFPQDHAREVFGSISLLDWLGQYDSTAPQEKLRGVLARALFSGDDAHKPVSVLSGGEAARLILAKMMLIKQNVLIFDEPTNHLDMESIEALSEALENYTGTVLMVSHNRYFIKKLASRIVELSQQGVVDFKCTYDEYMEKCSADLLNRSQTQRQAENLAAKSSSSNKEPQKLVQHDHKKTRRDQDQKEKKALAAEQKCTKLEKEIQEIDALFCKEAYFQKAPLKEREEMLQKKTLLEGELQRAFAEWEQFSSL